MSRFSAFLCEGFALLMFVTGTGGVAFVPGDVYDGEVLTKTPDFVEINIKPCAKEKRRITVRHYRLTELGDITCPGKDGRTYKKVHVEEIAPTTPSPNAPPARPPANPDTPAPTPK
jgi:hypothetical protein